MKLSRTEYEEVCAEKGIDTLPLRKNWTEGEVWEAWSYHATAGSRAERDIHQGRQQGYFEEQRNAPQPLPAPPSTPHEEVACDCGHIVTRNLVMTASFGTSCPECYDRMSD